MKYFLIFTLLFSICSYGQNDLVFDKKFVQSEDKWVAFAKDLDESYPFGFIYIDEDAGLTLNYEGTFKISANGEFIPTKLDTTQIKFRLEPNNVRVAFIPENKFQELKIDSIPEWLKFYKKDENSIKRLYDWGYQYNAWGECQKALEYLDKAYNQNPKYAGLRVELAYSHNCLGNYDKAIEYIMESIKDNPVTAYMVKELIYSHVKNGNLQAAINIFENFDPQLSDKTYSAENAYNILHGYYSSNDTTNFKRWLEKSNLKENEKYQPYIEQMKFQLQIND